MNKNTIVVEKLRFNLVSHHIQVLSHFSFGCFSSFELLWDYFELVFLVVRLRTKEDTKEWKKKARVRETIRG